MFTLNQMMEQFHQHLLVYLYNSYEPSEKINIYMVAQTSNQLEIRKS